MDNRAFIPTDHHGVDVETLLSTFINEKITSYREPVRKGRKRGEKIGLSRQKYYASLLFLLRMTLQEVSERTGVPHGVIGVWRTQQEFRDTINRHYEEFTILFLERIRQRVMEQFILFSGHLQHPIERLATPLPPLSYREFCDLNRYHPSLIAMIAEEAPRTEPENAFSIVSELFNIFDSAPATDTGKAINALMGELRAKWMAGILKNIRNMLTTPMSDEDRKEAALALSQIIGSLKTMTDS